MRVQPICPRESSCWNDVLLTKQNSLKKLDRYGTYWATHFGKRVAKRLTDLEIETGLRDAYMTRRTNEQQTNKVHGKAMEFMLLQLRQSRRSMQCSSSSSFHLSFQLKIGQSCTSDNNKWVGWYLPHGHWLQPHELPLPPLDFLDFFDFLDLLYEYDEMYLRPPPPLDDFFGITE